MRTLAYLQLYPWRYHPQSIPVLIYGSANQRYVPSAEENRWKKKNCQCSSPGLPILDFKNLVCLFFYININQWAISQINTFLKSNITAWQQNLVLSLTLVKHHVVRAFILQSGEDVETASPSARQILAVPGSRWWHIEPNNNFQCLLFSVTQ